MKTTAPESKRSEMAMTPGEIDAKIAAAEARSETGLAVATGEMRAEFAKLNARLDTLPNTWTLVTTIVGTGVGIVGLILAMLSLGGDRFTAGLDTSAAAQQAADRAVAAYATAHPAK